MTPISDLIGKISNKKPVQIKRAAMVVSLVRTSLPLQVICTPADHHVNALSAGFDLNVVLLLWLDAGMWSI